MESYYDFELWEAPSPLKITLVAACGVMTLVGIVGNIIIPVLVVKVKSLRSTVNSSLAVLCIADLIYLLYQPVTTMNWEFRKDDSNLGKHLCYFILFYEQGGVLCSTMIFIFISIERYIAICHPLVSLYYLTGKRTVCILTCIVLASLGMSVPSYIMSRYDTFDEANETLTFCYTSYTATWMKVYMTTTEVISNFGSIPFLLFIYISIITRITKKKATENVTTRKQTQGRRAGRLRTVIILLTAVVIFIICRFPRVMLEIFTMHFPEIYAVENALVNRESYAIYWFSWILLFINSQANPFIVISMSSTFRKEIKKCYSFQKCGASKRKCQENTDGVIGQSNTVSSIVSGTDIHKSSTDTKQVEGLSGISQDQPNKEKY